MTGYRAAGNILDQYPLLPAVLGISEPEETHYQPGDCTVHHGYCAHGSTSNTTDEDRLAYLWSYSPADTRYWGAAGSSGNPGTDRLRAEDERAFPVIPGIYPTVALEKQRLNVLGKLVIKWLSCTAK